MTRHARNSTAGSVYTYHEKKKDASSSGFGTERARLTKDSIKGKTSIKSISVVIVFMRLISGFDCCSLTLQPARIPVVTKDGYLFDKEAILEYIVAKKAEYARKMKEYERQKNSDEKELEEIAAAENKKKLEHFVRTEKNIKGQPSTSGAGNKSLSNMTGEKAKALPAFWVPSQTPDSGKAKLQKPENKIYCPISGEILKIKDLIDVKWTLAPDDPTDSKKSLIAKEARYVCAVTKDVLTNAQQHAVLRTTGDVVTMDCVEKLIKKDMTHPLTNEKLTDKDIIMLQRGGTGFASANVLEAKTSRPALQC
jgi:nitric oxide synthase-interacting protein